MQIRILKISLIALSILFLCGVQSLRAQIKFGYGVKAGMTFSQFIGPSEIGPDGTKLENYSNTNGFHVGGIFKFKFNNKMGLESGIFFHQTGTKYDFEGDSYFIFRDINNVFRYGVGIREETIEITNGNLQIPLTFYYRVNKTFEFNAGFYYNLMLGSQGQNGEIIFDGVSDETGEPIDRLRITLGYEYFKDNAGEFKGSRTRTVTIDGKIVVIPRTNGAYYTFMEVTDKLFRKSDLGMTGGVKVFLNNSLFVGTNVYYGFTDVTKTFADFSRLQLNEDKSFQWLEDRDTNLSFQLSIGFTL